MKKVAMILATLIASSSFAQPIRQDTTFIEDFTVSKDGTKIGYTKCGHGPSIVLVEGAMGVIFNYHQLAIALSHDFTVYVPERRGRGISPKPFSTSHSIDREIEDISSIINLSGAKYIFGLSSGAIITLEASRVLPEIKKVAIYEPPFYVNEPVPRKKIQQLFKEIDEKKTSTALATVFSITKVGPPIFNYVPRPILKMMTKAYLNSEDKQNVGQYERTRNLVPTMRYDFTVLLERSDKVDLYKNLNKPVLLMGGTKSPRYLKDALDTLTKILPDSHKVSFKNLDHSGPWNTDKGGTPQLVAEAIIKFFTK